MKRWNGWGDDGVDYPVKDTLIFLLEKLIGKGEYFHSVSKERVIRGIKKSRLIKRYSMISTDEMDRLYHCRGQSLPDWIDLRFGEVNTFPDGVAYPADEKELQELICLADKENFCIIPYGGGTSVLGHINPLDMDMPVVTVSMKKMNRLIGINEQNRVAEFYGGIIGPDIERALLPMGYRLGHFPQSYEFSSLGGWVVTKSSGQQSFGYGRINNMFLGGTLHTPRGVLEIPHIPASAAGPDIKQLVLGSEGRIGILSKIKVRITPIPEKEVFEGYFLPSWEAGYKVAKVLAQERYPITLLRLSNPKETLVHLAMAGSDLLIKLLKKYLSFRGIGRERCLLVVGYAGSSRSIRRVKKEVLSLVGKFKGISTYSMIGKAWQKNRFRAPYLRNSLWELGYAVDTLETSVPWDRVTSTMEDIERSLEETLTREGEKVYSFSHLSHFYITGPSIYTTYLYRVGRDHLTTLSRWKKLKSAASEAILRNKGTISHHHGVGLDHKKYLQAEKGEMGISVLRDMINSFDPKGIMNPGKLV